MAVRGREIERGLMDQSTGVLGM
jgi:hypothetical protein